MVKEDRMGLPGVGTPENDDIGGMDLLVRARPSARAEDRRQTDDRRGVSGPVAAVDVVGADDGADELAGEIVDLVRGLRAGEESEGVGTLPCQDTAEELAGPAEGLVPGGGPEDPLVPHVGSSEPRKVLHLDPW